jgi:hypothetical protein
MSRLINTTIDDLRCGRQNWRVIGALGTTAFIISVAATVLRSTF